jgi:hypothetical protein
MRSAFHYATTTVKYFHANSISGDDFGERHIIQFHMSRCRVTRCAIECFCSILNPRDEFTSRIRKVFPHPSPRSPSSRYRPLAFFTFAIISQKKFRHKLRARSIPHQVCRSLFTLFARSLESLAVSVDVCANSMTYFRRPAFNPRDASTTFRAFEASKKCLPMG